MYDLQIATFLRQSDRAFDRFLILSFSIVDAPFVTRAISPCQTFLSSFDWLNRFAGSDWLTVTVSALKLNLRFAGDADGLSNFPFHLRKCQLGVHCWSNELKSSEFS